MTKSNTQRKYIGNELELFKHAVRWKTYFSQRIIPHIKGDVLEVGAGLGINTQYMAKNLNIISSWSFVEPDVELANQIITNTSNIDIQKKFIINGVLTDIIDETFDTIIYIDVLEHIEESESEIEHVKTLLKSNGTLIILVPAYNFLFNNFDKRVGHYRRYSKKLLLGEVNNTLKTEKLFYLDSIGFFASLVNKLILRKEMPNRADIKFWDVYLVSCSKLFDRLFFQSFGKSLIGIFRNQ